MTRRSSKKQNLYLGALGVVYGDIGTSPLYAFRESLRAFHLEQNATNIIGVLSLIFWTLVVVVCLKYVLFVMRADNQGEGGTLALWALTAEHLKNKKKLFALSMVVGLIGTALFFGDCMITPAISVISAIEGLEVLTPLFKPIVVPITIAILIALFTIQKHGTARVGKFFGPIIVMWFVSIGLIGLYYIIHNPVVLKALYPGYALSFMFNHGIGTLMTLGAVMLCITGAEALYADMGHFGRRAISHMWFMLVFPALVLNYFGQGAFLLLNPTQNQNPFFEMIPSHFLIPMLILATLAAVIASQAVISGAFSVVRQAILLGFLPRVLVVHTSEDETGQIFLPFVNWLLFLLTGLLVIGFGHSSAMASAYGIAVSGTMLCSSLLLLLLAGSSWGWSFLKTNSCILPFILFDILLVISNSLKLKAGGWLPLLVAMLVLLVMRTWREGKQLQRESTAMVDVDLEGFLEALNVPGGPLRVPGVAVYLTAGTNTVPHAMLHNLKHNKVLHEMVIILTVITKNIPFVKKEERAQIEVLSQGFYRVSGYFGFMDKIDIPAFMRMCQNQGLPGQIDQVSYFLSRQRVIPSAECGMALWREQLYAAMVVNSANATDFFQLPQNQVIELGARVEI